MGLLSKIFGSNEREVTKIKPIVDSVNGLAETMKALPEDGFVPKTQELKDKISQGAVLEDVLPEAFALTREAADRVIGERHYDTQIMGGYILHTGKIAEMKTGEGKTLTSTLPIYLNALNGKGVHVVTVNDYLARRDCNWMGAIYAKLGLSAACITNEGGFLYEPNAVSDEQVEDEVHIEEENLRKVSKKEAYDADITYGTNNEFGFDYLRDNMATSAEGVVQREPHFAIVDEVDSILIDEARTPLIISAPDNESTQLYGQFAKIVPSLVIEEDFSVDEKERSVTITDNGIAKVEKALGLGNIYQDGKWHYVHHLEQSLKAHVIFERDKDYMVRDGQVVIVDEFTGRAMDGRRYSDGLHQAIEAKERVTVQRESKTLATITFQNYFRMYEKIAGMTGTASTSSEELQKVYGLEVVEVPTNRDIVRQDLADVIYKTERGKYDAIVGKIKELHAAGQPVLVGTVAIEKSELLSHALEKSGVAHSVLNAKFHEKEAEIIAAAGKYGAVTIATNMAGRGTDIKLDDDAKEAGGLYIIGTERHDARRIDNQLRGRSGRQGDPGTTQFYISLEDELMRRFGGDKLGAIMEKLGLPEDQPIQNALISKQIENAQSKIEGFNFDIRKHVLEYDDVINKQRTVIYDRRKKVLLGAQKNVSIKSELMDLQREEIESIVSFHAIEGQHQWDADKIADDAREVFGLDATLGKKIQSIIEDPKYDERESIGAMIEYLQGQAKHGYGLKEQELGVEQMRSVESQVLLQTIDQQWKTHIDTIDHLRQGIGLRGYGQRDPLIEFKREAFDLFSGLVGSIRRQTLRTLFHIQAVTPVTAPDVQVSPHGEDLTFSGADNIAGSGPIPDELLEMNTEQLKSESDNMKPSMPVIQKPASTDKTIGRNDPCTCGSGKKYKRCHGRA